MHPLENSALMLLDGPALAARMARDGYLYLPGLLPMDVVASLQVEVAALARTAGWLRADAPLADAIADPGGFCVDPEPRYLAVLRQINRLERYHALKHHPALLDFFARMLGAPVFPHPRVLMRNIFPAQPEYTTKAHQDYPNVQGTTEVYTAWIPLIDCPLERGGLQVARGSHLLGVLDFGVGNGAGGIEILDALEGRWTGGPMRVGDVLVFHSLTAHKGIENRSDRLRMSIDCRFQRVRDPFNPDNANPDGQPLTWEEVYADWRSDALQYYWRRLPLTEVPFDRTWFDRRDTLGLELGAAGDPRARSVLQRIVARDRDPAKRAEAARLLAALDAAGTAASAGATRPGPAAD
jgi:Phytanoyl-CoA dioxygenase (PhyH)